MIPCHTVRAGNYYALPRSVLAPSLLAAMCARGGNRERTKTACYQRNCFSGRILTIAWVYLPFTR
jgi:hypothetical protein